ncbi:hypothetical protein WUBG_09888, partial [Wuchereria bancrofti]
MAKILNISHPDAADALSAFLKNKLKTNYKDILDVEDTLIELLHDLDAQPNVTSVSYSFPPMHSELRRIIHEYSGHFGIETVSYGQEPQRNVVATARRDVSYMPAVLLTASKKYTTESSLLASSSAAFAPSKTLPPTSKNFSCGGSKMQQLQSGGKVLKRGFEEQYCLCGQTIREPPIPCGTPLPSCNQPCSRQHSCDHPPLHNCHAEPECPPCT